MAICCECQILPKKCLHVKVIKAYEVCIYTFKIFILNICLLELCCHFISIELKNKNKFSWRIYWKFLNKENDLGPIFKVSFNIVLIMLIVLRYSM